MPRAPRQRKPVEHSSRFAIVLICRGFCLKPAESLKCGTHIRTTCRCSFSQIGCFRAVYLCKIDVYLCSFTLTPANVAQTYQFCLGRREPSLFISAEPAQSINPPPAEPCRECVWRRASEPGAFLPDNGENILATVEGPAAVLCHMSGGVSPRQCCGASAYRANSGRERPIEHAAAAKPAPRVDVFANHVEFLAHHLDNSAGVR